jgi:hypothetical protein
METNHQKIEKIVAVVCNYYNFDEKFIDFNTRKVPVPFIKKMIAFQIHKHTPITQMEVAKYFNQNNHSNVSIGIQYIFDQLDLDPAIKKNDIDISSIIIEKGLSKKSPKNNNWYKFLNLNDFFLASSGDQSILFHNTTIDEIQKILPKDKKWEITEHLNTNNFFYNRNINQNATVKVR